VKAFCLFVDPYLESCSSRRRDLDLGSLQARTMLEVKRYLYYAEALQSVVRETGNDGTLCLCSRFVDSECNSECGKQAFQVKEVKSFTT
jgi:hypothetical protein